MKSEQSAMDRIREMQIFNQVVDSGSFTRAADALSLARSTISTALQTLEDRMRSQLPRRTTRQVVPTRDGLEFLPLAREIVEAADRAAPCSCNPRTA